MLPPLKHFAIFKIKLLCSPFTVIGHGLHVHTPGPTQTGKSSFPRASAFAQGRPKGSSSVLVIEFPWGNFTQYLCEELQSSLPICYLAIHTEPKHSASKDDTDKNSDSTLKSNLWEMQGNSADCLLQWSLRYLSFLHHLCQVQASQHKRVKNFQDDLWVSFHLKYRSSPECGLSKLIEFSAPNACFYSCYLNFVVTCYSVTLSVMQICPNSI